MSFIKQDRRVNRPWMTLTFLGRVPTFASDKVFAMRPLGVKNMNTKTVYSNIHG